MHCHSIIKAADLAEARLFWKEKIRANGYACQPAYDNRPEELWELPEFLQSYSKTEILDYYDPPKPCSFLTKNGCSCAVISGCNKGHLRPYGCYTKVRDEWETKWRVIEPARSVRTYNSLLAVIRRLWSWL